VWRVVRLLTESRHDMMRTKRSKTAPCRCCVVIYFQQPSNVTAKKLQARTAAETAERSGKWAAIDADVRINDVAFRRGIAARTTKCDLQYANVQKLK